MNWIVLLWKWVLSPASKVYSFFKQRKDAQRESRKKRAHNQFAAQELFDVIKANMAHHFVSLHLIENPNDISSTQLLQWADDINIMARIREVAPGLYQEMIRFRDLHESPSG